MWIKKNIWNLEGVSETQEILDGKGPKEECGLLKRNQCKQTSKQTDLSFKNMILYEEERIYMRSSVRKRG